MRTIALWLACTAIMLLGLKSLARISAEDATYPRPSAVQSLSNPAHYNPVAHYEGEPEDDLSSVQCPIPMEDRVPNKTGIQCVWSSIETLARWADFERLYDMTERPECRSYSSPSSAGAWLRKHNVKFEQTTSKSDRRLLIKGCVEDGRGVAFAVPRHMMVLVHYDEAAGVVKYINNSDRSLKVRTWTMDEFNRRWDGWLLIIYPDEDDPFSRSKLRARELPIIDRNNPQGNYPKDYIPVPK